MSAAIKNTWIVKTYLKNPGLSLFKKEKKTTLLAKVFKPLERLIF